jgi:hypothetical protein
VLPPAPGRRRRLGLPHQGGGGQRDAHAPVLFALFLDVRHRDAADLTCRAHVRTAARLQVDVADLDQAHAAGAARRLHRHGLHEVRVGVELFVGDPALAHGRVARDQLVQPLRELAFVESGLGNVEVEPSLAIADGAAGHRVGQDDAEEMQGRVDAHTLVAPLPVEPRGDWLAGLQRARVRRHMHDTGPVGAVDRVGDNDADIPPGKLANVARLAAALGVEYGAVEHDAALRRDADDDGVAFAGVGVVAEEESGGGHRPRARAAATVSRVKPACKRTACRRPRRRSRPRSQRLANPLDRLVEIGEHLGLDCLQAAARPEAGLQEPAGGLILAILQVFGRDGRENRDQGAVRENELTFRNDAIGHHGHGRQRNLRHGRPASEVRAASSGTSE